MNRPLWLWLALLSTATAGCCHHCGFGTCGPTWCAPPALEDGMCGNWYGHYGYGWRSACTLGCFEDDPCAYAMPDCGTWNECGGCGGCSTLLARLFGHKRCRCPDYFDCCDVYAGTVCPAPMMPGGSPAGSPPSHPFTPAAPEYPPAAPEYNPVPQPEDPKQGVQPSTLLAPPRTRPLSTPAPLEDGATAWRRTQL